MVMDVVYVVAVLALFGATWGFVLLCEKLG